MGVELGYMAFLAGALPVRELAGAAARKAAGKARALRGRAAAPSDAELLACFGAADAEALAGALALPRLPALWADRARAADLTTLCASDPALRERLVLRAEAAAAGRLSVYGREVRLAGQGDWTCDPVTGSDFDAGPLLPGSDPKRVWQLGRLDWAVALGLGAHAAPERADRFAAALAERVDAFLDAASPAGIHWASPMEVALRAANLACALQLLRGHERLHGNLLLRCLRALWEHAAFVEANLEDTPAVPNNHLVGDLCGLLHVALLYPELPGARRWRELALRGLREQADAQVLPDGMGFEASAPYHRLLLELLLSAQLVARAAGASLGERYAPALQRMFRATRAYLDPAGRAPQLGDDDSGRGLPFDGRASLDHGYLCSLGAALFGDASLKRAGEPLCDEGLVLLGRRGLETYARLAPTPDPGTAALPEGGLAIVRGGGLWASLSCGSTGQRGVGGHGHNDKLGVELRAGVNLLVVDPGSPTYLMAGGERDRFRSTAMHSTVQLDGLEQAPLPARPFALPDRARARLVRCQGDRAAATHEAWARLEQPVWARREVRVAAAQRAFVIEDELAGAGEHRAVARFHLPDAEARLRPLSAAERARLAELGGEWDAEQAVELGPAGAPRALWVPGRGGAVRLEESAYAPGYDRVVKALCIEFEVAGALPLRPAAVVLVINELPNGEG